MGSIVKTMFSSFFLFEAGFGKGDVSIFLQADEGLGASLSSSLDSPWSLHSSAIKPLVRLLELYDSQLQTTPVCELVVAHQRATKNFNALPHERLSISALVQRRGRPECSR